MMWALVSISNSGMTSVSRGNWQATAPRPPRQTAGGGQAGEPG